MIIGRIALFFAMLFGLASTQAPEFWQQYRQRLGAAVDELSAIVAQFDAQNAQQHLSESAAVDHLEHSPDPVVQGQGDEMQRFIARLARLRRAQAAFDEPNLAVRWLKLASAFDVSIAERAYAAYQPAVPATAEGFIAGLIGFIIGGGLVHLIGLPIKHRHKLFGRRKTEPAELKA